VAVPFIRWGGARPEGLDRTGRSETRPNMAALVSLPYELPFGDSVSGSMGLGRLELFCDG